MDFTLYEITVILLLIIECWLLWFYAREHATLMSIIAHHISEIRKKVAQEEEARRREDSK